MSKNTADFVFLYNIYDILKVINLWGKAISLLITFTLLLIDIFVVKLICIDCPVICNMNLWSVVSQGFTSGGDACNALAQHCGLLLFAGFF